MRQSYFGFFLVALAAELGTSWLQKFFGAREVASGLYYTNVGSMMAYRLIIWLVLFLLLSALWLLISRGPQRS